MTKLLHLARSRLRSPAASPPREPWLVKHPAEWRQIGIVAVYLGLLASMYLVPACRNVAFLGAACYSSFLNAVVIHNHLHQGIFKSRRLNLAWRVVLSFGALDPASASIPSHNLVHHRFDDDGQPDWAAPGGCVPQLFSRRAADRDGSLRSRSSPEPRVAAVPDASRAR